MTRTQQITKSALLGVALVFLAGGLGLAADADEKIKQAIDKGLVTRDFLNTLTPEDVPQKWRAEKSVKETDSTITQVYKRNGVRVLQVMWSKDPKQGEKMFVADIFYGEKRLAKILRLADSTAVMPEEGTKGFQVCTSLKDDGTETVMVIKTDTGFFDSVVVKGRDTHIMDDLEYTKSALMMGSVVKPLINAIEESIGTKPKKRESQK